MFVCIAVTHFNRRCKHYYDYIALGAFYEILCGVCRLQAVGFRIRQNFKIKQKKLTYLVPWIPGGLRYR